jgi:hypothetical protein
MLEDRQGVSSDKFWKMEITRRGIPRKTHDQRMKKKSSHEDDGPVTSILRSRKVDVRPRVKSIVEASAYRTEDRSLVVLQVNWRSAYNKTIELWNLIDN